MKITILTLFPEMFAGPLNHSILKNAVKNNKVKIDIVNLRNYGIGKHKTIDDKPYGGGVGMVLKVDVIQKAIEDIKNKNKKLVPQKIVVMDPRGNTFTQNKAKEYSKLSHLILICGHYEGVDERTYDYIDEGVSIGDFILTGGEIPAMAIADSVTRLLPDVLSNDATSHESFSMKSGKNNLLEYPHYTRPANFKGKGIPLTLLSGNHSEIKKWREQKSLEYTKKNRPEMLKTKEGA